MPRDFCLTFFSYWDQYVAPLCSFDYELLRCYPHLQCSVQNRQPYFYILFSLLLLTGLAYSLASLHVPDKHFEARLLLV